MIGYSLCLAFRLIPISLSLSRSIVDLKRSSFPLETTMNKGIQEFGHAKKTKFSGERFYFEH